MTAPERPWSVDDLAGLAALGWRPEPEAEELGHPSPAAIACWEDELAQLAWALPPASAAEAAALKAPLFARLGLGQPPEAAPQPSPSPQATPAPAAAVPPAAAAPPEPPAPQGTVAPAWESLPGGRLSSSPKAQLVPFPRRRPWAWPALTAGLLVGLGLSLGWGWRQQLSLEVATRERERLAERLEQVQGQLAQVQGELKQASLPTSLMQSPELRVTALQATTPSVPVRARLFWSEADMAWTLVVGGLPQPKAGEGFHAWAVGPQGKVNLGSFRPDAHGMAVVKFEWPMHPSAEQVAAISLESALAPMPEPKGPILLMGKLKGASL